MQQPRSLDREHGILAAIRLDETEAIHPSERLRHLIARRYEAAETNQGRPWKSFDFLLGRVGATEWRCELRYEFV